MPIQRTANPVPKTRSSFESHELPDFPALPQSMQKEQKFFAEMRQAWYDLKRVLLELEQVESISVQEITQIVSAGTTSTSSVPTPHDHDGRYYTETELNAGQLNSLYYTESEITALLAGFYTQAQVDGLIEASRDRIELQYLSAYNTYYKERTRDVDEYITQIDIWDSALKTTKLFTKTFTWNTGYLTGSVLTNEISGETLTKTMTYDGAGLLTNSTRAYT